VRRHVHVLIATFLTSTSFGAALPFVAARLEALGISGGLLGLNAAMSALGFLLGSLGLPLLQERFSTKRILLVSLASAAVVWTAFFLWRDYWSWTALRLLLGASMGLFFRTVEFCLNTGTDNGRRPAVFGYYNLAFGGGIALGAALVPLAGDTVLWSLGCAGYALAAVAATRWELSAIVVTQRGSAGEYLRIASLTPLPLVAAFTYGLLESIPGYFLPIYALRIGLGPEISAYSLTVAALGAVVVPVLFGLRGDRIGQRTSLLLAALGLCLASAGVSISVPSAALFLAAVSIWGGFFATIYTASLSILGSEHGLDSLPQANSAFGVAYASGALAGPLVNGISIDTLSSHGLMLTAVVASSVLAALCLIPGGRRAPGRR
jgi:MFS family permease